MGRDKAQLELGGRTLLAVIRTAASAVAGPVRVIRRDLRPGLGPLGGVHAGLKTSRHAAELFLACDMPLITPSLLRGLLAKFDGRHGAVFVEQNGLAGFPMVIRTCLWPIVEQHLAQGRRSLQDLVHALRGRAWVVPPGWQLQLENINTPAEWKRVRQKWRLSRVRVRPTKSRHKRIVARL